MPERSMTRDELLAGVKAQFADFAEQMCDEDLYRLYDGHAREKPMMDALLSSGGPVVPMPHPDRLSLRAKAWWFCRGIWGRLTIR